jgi:hypothetical protein
VDLCEWLAGITFRTSRHTCVTHNDQPSNHPTNQPTNQTNTQTNNQKFDLRAENYAESKWMSLGPSGHSCIRDEFLGCDGILALKCSLYFCILRFVFPCGLHAIIPARRLPQMDVRSFVGRRFVVEWRSVFEPRGRLFRVEGRSLGDIRRSQFCWRSAWLGNSRAVRCGVCFTTDESLWKPQSR